MIFGQGYFNAMNDCTDVDALYREYSGTERSVQPSTRQSNSNGEKTYCACVESPTRWGYAITMESEKHKYEQLTVRYEQTRVKYEQMKVKYEYLKARCEQIKVICEHSRARCELLQEQIHDAKLHRQTCECNTSSINVQFDSASDAKTKAEYTGSKPLLELPSDIPSSTCALHTDKMCKICRMSRVRLISCKFHSKKKREREPSRIPYRKVIKLFRKTRIIRLAAKSYLKKYIPSSSKLRLVLFEYNRCHFPDRFGGKKVYID